MSDDTRIIIRTGVEQLMTFTVHDQNDRPVENAKVWMKKDDAIVSSGVTDDTGLIELSVPRNGDPYDLLITLNGVECYQDQISFSLLSPRKMNQEINIERYDITLEVIDDWGLAPGVDLIPILLTSTEKSLGSFEQISDNTYQFLSLPPDEYQLILKYKSVEITERITLDNDISLSLTFPARFQTTIHVLDNHGLGLSDVRFIIQRDDIKKRFTSDDGIIRFVVPPGRYLTMLYKDDTMIAQRNLMISGDESYDYVSAHEPIYPLLVIIILILTGLVTLYLLYVNDRLAEIITILPIILILASLVLPWWGIQGSYQDIETKTQLFFIPSTLITITEASDVLIGDQGYLPDLFFTMIYGIIGMMISSIFLIIVGRILKKQKGFKQILLLILPIIFLAGALGVFVFGMSTLSEISVGTFMGNGPLDISVGGQERFQQIPSHWGPSIGFYALLISLIITFLPLINTFRKTMVNRFERQH
jgi:hypothetical protein